MTTNHQPHDDDIVDRTAEALRSLEVPEGPSDRLIASTVEALRTLDSRAALRPLPQPLGASRPDRRSSLMIRIVRYGSLTAALTLMFGFIAVTVLPGREAAAFSDVVRSVSRVKSVAFHWKLASHPGEGSEFRMKDDRVRMDLIGDVTIIGDLSEKRGIRVNHQRKTAWTFQGDASFAKIFNPIEELREVKPENMVPVEVQERGGLMTDVYRLKEGRLLGVTLDNSETTLTTDPETDLPMRIEIKLLNMKPIRDDEGAARDVTMVFEDFRWDAPLDDAVFSQNPPDGFTVIALPLDDGSAVGGKDPDSPPSADELEVLRKLDEERSRKERSRKERSR